MATTRTLFCGRAQSRLLIVLIKFDGGKTLKSYLAMKNHILTLYLN